MKLKHETVGSFAEEFATNLSPGGMFIRSRTPQPVGTPVKFEVQIAGGVRVLRGSAHVRWVREVGDPAGPPGMGLQFQELDEASRALVDMMLQRKSGAAASAATPLPSVAPVVAPTVAPAVAPSVAPAVAPAVAPVAPRVAPAQPRPATPVPSAPTRPVAAPVPSAPARPVAAPVPPARPAAPAPRAAGGMALDSLFDDLESSAGPAAPVGDEPFSFPPPVSAEPRTPAPFPVPPISYTPPPPVAANDVDIPLEELIASTPPPAPLDVDESLPGFDFEMEAPVTGTPLDEPPIEVGVTVEVESSSQAASPSGGALEFELDLGDAVAAPPPRAVPPPPPRAAVPPPPPPGGAFEFELDMGGVEEAAPPPPPRPVAKPAPPPPPPA
ncbi:TIGR02266 family protein, partial [Pyxidicoccus fallax]|uniref:TIGR02266 family protein n=2 Tax=Pyxidicoccus fallax TaxID=394095 RepID=UPI0031B5AEDA